MSPSPRFNTLVGELNALRQHLLPKEFEPTGDYPPEVLTRALAYRVLVHAEIESYFEERVLDVSRENIRRFLEVGEVRRALVSLMAFSGMTHETPPDSLAPEQPNQAKQWPHKIELAERLLMAMNAFDAVVRRNHGVKESNLLKLLLPVGVAVGELDPVFLANMNTFGENRGAAAHSSGAMLKTRQPPDPEQELRSVQEMLKEVQRIDSYIDALLE